MKTIEISLYKFNELSEAAQQKAIENERENVCVDFIYDDAYSTVKAFNNVFGTSEGRNSWLDVDVSNFNDAVLELQGFRLQKYLWNNFNNELFKGAFIGSLKSNEIFSHPRIKSKKLSNGKVFNPYHSGIKKDNSCVLTGMCYDDDMLQPIYDFLQKRDFSNCTIDFESLINDCFDELRKTVENEIEYRNSDEAISEDLNDNDQDFLKSGKLY